MKRRVRLIELRSNKRLLQRQVAEACGITTSYYGMIELGTRTPTLEIAMKIAEFFETTVEDIFFNDLDNSMLSNINLLHGRGRERKQHD